MGNISPEYWQVNVRPDQWTRKCPGFLQGLSEKDVGILSMTDAQFRDEGLILGWKEVQDLVHSGRIGDFKRIPSHLRRYKAFTFQLKNSPGGIMGYILKARLQWRLPIVPRGALPFQCPDDFKILFNDWPYGIHPDIVHLVVWTKFKLEEDPATTELTPWGRRQVEEFVRKTFRSRLPEGNVIWFKNTDGFKSVDALEHFHIMLYQPDPGFLRDITNEDVPLPAQLDEAIL